MKEFSKDYHTIITIIFIIAGYVSLVLCFIAEHGIVIGLLAGIGASIMGTLCFLFLPALFTAVSIISRFIPVLAIFFWLDAYIYDDKSNYISALGENALIISLFVTLFGLFNVYTAIKGNSLGCDIGD